MRIAPLITALIALQPLGMTPLLAGDVPTVLEETFTAELSKDWFWGLGTWTAKDGILRGFESGPRRHGPVKMRRHQIKDGVLECQFRLEGRATFAGIIFNGSQERGHIVHLVIGTDTLRVIAHPKTGAGTELFKQANPIATGTWHTVKIQFKGPAMTATVDGTTLTVSDPCIAETKETFGLGGDSGGPDGEKAGALEFRALKVTR